MNQDVLDIETRRFGHLLHGAFALLAVVAVAVAYFFLYTPMVEGSGDVRGRIADVQAELRLAPEVRKEHSDLRKRLADVTERMQELRTRIPKEDRITEFVSQVTEAADEEELEIEDFDVRERVQKTGYSVQQIKFTGNGKYAGICRLIDRVQSLPRLTKVIGLDLNTSSIGQEVYPMTLTVLVYYGLTVDSETGGGAQTAGADSELGGGQLDD